MIIRFKFKRGSLSKGKHTGLASQDSFLNVVNVKKFSMLDLLSSLYCKQALYVTRSFFSRYWWLSRLVCWRFHGLGPYRDNGLLESSFKLKHIRSMVVTIDGSFSFSTFRNFKRLKSVCLVYNRLDTYNQQSEKEQDSYVTVSRRAKIMQDLGLYRKLQQNYAMSILTNDTIEGLEIIKDQNFKVDLLDKGFHFVSINRFGTFSNSVIEALNYGCAIHYVLTDAQAYNFGPLIRLGVGMSIQRGESIFRAPVYKNVNNKTALSWHQIHSKEIQYLSAR